jgi:hypothetical protein
MRESVYQSRLIKRIQNMFPSAVIIKNDSSYIQGIPDLVIYHGPYWAMLEVKASIDAPTQPNQEYWVNKMDSMSYASFICPETEDGVLHELQHALGVGR